MVTAPHVSVVVSTYQRAGRLPRLIAAMEAQDLDVPFEVVVVDNGSTDNTGQVLARLADSSPLDLRPVRLEANVGPSGGRNAGWRAARAPVVAFTDDDCRPAPGWLSALLRAMDEVAVAQGRTEPDPEDTYRRGPFSRTVEITCERGYYETCNIAYRRDLLERLGGFDQRYRLTGEDTDLAWRARSAGSRTAFVDDAIVFHEISDSSYRAWVAATRRWGDVPLTVRRHPHLRQELYYSRWFWRSSHPKAIAAFAGVVVGAWPGGPRSVRVARVGAAVALARPYVRFRTHVAPVRNCGPRRQRVLIPLVWIADLAEVVVLARASIRHRSLYL